MLEDVRKNIERLIALYERERQTKENLHRTEEERC